MEDRDDLILLAADKQMEEALRGILSRPQALEIRRITFDVFRHPGHDAGCREDAHDFLRPFHTRFHHALVLFDYHGCGASHLSSPEEVRQDVENKLRQSGWDDRARCVVIDPELEVWVWSDSSEVDRCLDWTQSPKSLRDWLEEKGHWPSNTSKPPDPKEAVEAALKEVKKPRSSALFRELAESVSLQRCEDEAFQRFRNILSTWFPPEWHELSYSSLSD